ncbi:MAG: hypothetical protein A3J75_08410 [Acidobacteria bacterium RBG_16_68_9]|nr:MAG: hypothetical protein A3J75_08410 [Acidobacteria bacterium RBG_16_68_9]
MEVQEFRADGNEITVSGSGQVTVRTPVGDSVLNLKVTLQPGPGSTEAVKGLLNLVPRAKGSRPDAPVTISGTIARPRFR